MAASGAVVWRYAAWRAVEKIAVNGNVSFVDAAIESNEREYRATSTASERATSTEYEQRRAARRGHVAKMALIERGS